MINLLPPVAKKKLTRERILRFISMVFFALGIAGLIFLSLSLPTMVMLKKQLNSILDDKDFVHTIEIEQKLLEKDAEEVGAIVAHINNQKATINHTEIIDLIDQLAGDGVVVSRFVFDEEELVISGTASTRPELSNFRDRLVAEGIFSSVELPLSTLVNERDAIFNITTEIK